MPRPSLLKEQRKRLLPVVARAFSELGYRRTTTAKLAERCGIRENILYRHWPDKKAMFIAAIEYVYQLSKETWTKVLRRDGERGSGAQRLLRYESVHHGEFGLYRIVFAGLSETDDPDIRSALRRMYGQFHRLIQAQLSAHRQSNPRRGAGEIPAPDLSAWAIVGLGTVANIGRELGFASRGHRERLIAEVGELILNGRGNEPGSGKKAIS